MPSGGSPSGLQVMDQGPNRCGGFSRGQVWAPGGGRRLLWLQSSAVVFGTEVARACWFPAVGSDARSGGLEPTGWGRRRQGAVHGDGKAQGREQAWAWSGENRGCDSPRGPADEQPPQSGLEV